MTRGAQTIGPHLLASEALNLMEKRKITSIVVVDEAKAVLGVVHLHDLSDFGADVGRDAGGFHWLS